MRPDLDTWIARPAIQLNHRRSTAADPAIVWRAAQEVRLSDTRLLGRLVRWRIPGTPAGTSFRELFTRPPFMVLEEDPEGVLVSGLVGRIWTLRRDYPKLADPSEYLSYHRAGNARVLLAHWLERDARSDQTVLCSESRVEVFGFEGRLGLRLVRPLVRRFAGLVGSEGLAAAVRLAERRQQQEAGQR